MDRLYGLARVIAGFLGFTSLVGVIWFGAALSDIEVSGGLVFGLASLTLAVVPKRKLKDTNARRAVTSLCVVGGAAGAILVATNLASPYPVEWDVVAINLFNIGALLAIAAKAQMVARNNDKGSA